MRVSFAECLFDSDIRALLRSGEVVHLSPKAFRLLELLLENRPRVMSKDQIVAALWPDTFVTDGSLANLVAEVRAALAAPKQPALPAHRPRFSTRFRGVGLSGARLRAGSLPLRLVSRELYSVVTTGSAWWDGLRVHDLPGIRPRLRHHALSARHASRR